VRGIRYAVEGPAGLEVTLNDADPLAAALCTRNAARNGITGARVTSRRLEPLLAEERFDLVDIDPFGSPARFLAGGVRAVRRGGVLALTATDTPALCGSTPRPCARRYGARPWRGEAMHEVGLRILIGAVVREAARTDLVAEPVLSMAEDHYVRVFLRVGKGAQRADAVLKLVGYAWRGEDGGVATGPHAPGGPCPWPGPWAGPLWLGPLHDRAVVAALEPAEHMGTRVRLGRLRELWLEEADLPPLLVDVNELSGRLRLPTPRMADVIGRLRDQGFRAGRAHTNPQGIKTDAPMGELRGAIEALSGKSA
jgi:tRNA (guanine26-N2/guanine27-N2)-dimethyltransferase